MRTLSLNIQLKTKTAVPNIANAPLPSLSSGVVILLMALMMLISQPAAGQTPVSVEIVGVNEALEQNIRLF